MISKTLLRTMGIKNDFWSSIQNEDNISLDSFQSIKNTSNSNSTPKSYNEKKKILQNLFKEQEKIESIAYKRTSTNATFGHGSIDSKVMMIGEAPGEEEDTCGIPFVGKSGMLLNKIIAKNKFYRDIKKVCSSSDPFEINKNYKNNSEDHYDLYMTNVVPWRPIKNKTPTQKEINIMTPYLKEHIQIIKPKVIGLIGSVPMKSILNLASITRVRGNVYFYDDSLNFIDSEICNDDGDDLFETGKLSPSEFIDKVKLKLQKYTYCVVPTLHPAYIMRVQSQKKYLERDISLIRKIFEITFN